MSGVELVGLAASILQIADLGWKLSYKLYAFSRKIHEAGKNIELISQDISATGAVLKQFADELDKDEKASAGGRLASLELIKAARSIVEECETLFKEIDTSIDGGGGNKVILVLKAKLKWSHLEPRIQLLSLNLGRLKASLALMLNVLVYAEQIRGYVFAVLCSSHVLTQLAGTQWMFSESRKSSLKVLLPRKMLQQRRSNS